MGVNDGERYRNHCSYEAEQEQHQDRRSLINYCSTGDSSCHRHAGQDDLRNSCDNFNGVGLESSHHLPPSNHINLNPQESGPFGLSLRKSTSLSNLIETTLTQENQRKIKREEECLSQPSSEKLKASNFPAIFLQIGSWNWVSKNEGDLVAKIYYAKKKLVWELLVGSFKRKMEIPWSEISAINAFIGKGENGHLEIELNNPPQFGQELNSQPRKHTQWTPMEDFTGEQALICKRHKIEFLPGVLDKHLEKLLQCDNRLLHLSRQPFPVHNSPFIPGTFLNFSHKQSVVGCSSVVPPNGPFVKHISSSLPSTDLNLCVIQEIQKNGDLWEQSGKFHIQDPVIEEQDHLIPYHGPESMILDPYGKLNLNDFEHVMEAQSWFEADSTFKPFDHQQKADENYHDNISDHGGTMNQFGFINYEDTNQQWW